MVSSSLKKANVRIIGILLLAIYSSIILGCSRKDEFSINVDLFSDEIFRDHFGYYIVKGEERIKIIIKQGDQPCAINYVSQNRSYIAAFSVTVFKGSLANFDCDYYLLFVYGKRIVYYKVSEFPSSLEWANEQDLIVSFPGAKTKRIRSPFKNGPQRAGPRDGT